MSYTLDIKDRCVLITGASSGLGAHFANLAANAGAQVVLAARRQERIEQHRDNIRQRGGKALAVVMDVCDETSITDALLKVDSDFAPVDVLVNNAGISITKTFLDTKDEDWRKLIDTNLIGLATVARHTATAMKARGQGGSIINVGSILGARPGNMAAAYATTKAGVIHLSRGMAVELARYGIRVNSLLPGFIPTELTEMDEHALQRLQKQIPQRRLGTPEDLDGAFMLLASDASRYMTGSSITVDGGHASNSL